MGGQHPVTGRAGLDSQFTDALVRTRRYFTRGEVSPDLRALFKTGGRDADSFYRDRWSHDEVVRSTHGVNCTDTTSSAGPPAPPSSTNAGSAVTLGTISGFATLAGAAILIYRRRTTGPVFSATTCNDKIMYVLLIGTIALGLGTTVVGSLTGHPHDYRLTVAPWFRFIFYLHPGTALILRAPIGFRLHVLAAWALFACWPFSRLVHVFSAPLGYLTRPYVVYRSRDPRLGARPARRGWERI